MATPAVTIGLMTHNYGRYIAEAIESVLAQDRDDWEIVISDDASTDGTADVVRPYLADPRLTYVRHEANLGQAGNWAFLLDQGRAPVLAVLHADDHWLPGMLEAALPAFEADPRLDVFYTNWWRQIEGRPAREAATDEAPHTGTGHDEYRRQVRKYTAHVSATFMTRRTVEAAGRPDPTLKMLVDYEYFLRVLLHARQVTATGTPLAVYRAHVANATAEGTASGLLLREKERMPDLCARQVRDFPALRGCLPAVRRHMAGDIFTGAVTAAMQGDVRAGRERMAGAVRLNPALLCGPRLLDFLLCRPGRLPAGLLRRLHPQRAAALTEAASR